MRGGLLSFCVAVLVGCGPTDSKVTNGTYTFVKTGSDSLEGATLLVELAGKQATLTPDGGAPVVLKLAAAPATLGCPAQYSSVNLETFAITPDPVTLAAHVLAGAQLQASCGADGAKPSEVVIVGTAAAVREQLVFAK